MHGLDFVHGDLSLKNVLVDRHGDACVCDMGAVFCVRTGLCSCQDVRTTAYVRAPESWLGAPMRAAADVWALGVIALALFSGKIPWLLEGERDEPDAVTFLSRVAKVIGLPEDACPGARELVGQAGQAWDRFIDSMALAGAPRTVCDQGAAFLVANPESRPLQYLSHPGVEFTGACLRWFPSERASIDVLT